MHGLKNAICYLDSMFTLSVRGKQARKLLQGQLTCDMNVVTCTQASLGALCNLQGKMRAVFKIIQVSALEDKFYLSMPVCIAADVIKHFNSVAPFFKVDMQEVTNNYKVVALVGADSLASGANLLSVSLSAINCQHLGVTKVNNNIVMLLNFPHSQPAVLIWLDRDNLPSITANLTDSKLCSSQVWDRFCVTAGIADIYESTADMFLPQVFNLHHLEGLSFTKGCYLGQEIVARILYKGKVKKALCLAYLTTPSTTPAKIDCGAVMSSLDGVKIVTLVGIAPAPSSSSAQFVALVVINIDVIAPQLDLILDDKHNTLVQMECEDLRDWYS